MPTTCPSSALDSKTVLKYGFALFIVCRIFISQCYILWFHWFFYGLCNLTVYWFICFLELYICFCNHPALGWVCVRWMRNKYEIHVCSCQVYSPIALPPPSLLVYALHLVLFSNWWWSLLYCLLFHCISPDETESESVSCGKELWWSGSLCFSCASTLRKTFFCAGIIWVLVRIHTFPIFGQEILNSWLVMSLSMQAVVWLLYSPWWWVGLVPGRSLTNT